MKIVVMGAGAVGCYFGGMLARAGHEVTLVGRAPHVEAIRRDGLRLETRSGIERIALAATTEADGVAGADLVLVAVKSAASEEAAAAMAPHLSPGAVVWSLQNGVDNAERLSRVLARPVSAAVVYVATEMAGPGHVLHRGRGELVVGEDTGNADLAALFTDAGVPTTLSGDVEGALWAKFLLNCAYNALSALTRMPYGPLVEQPGVTAVIADVAAECVAVAAAAGVTIPGDVDAALAGIVTSMPEQYSSTAQDLARGKPSEIDYLNGHVVRLGERLGVPTPANRVLHVLVKIAETGRPVGAG